MKKLIISLSLWILVTGLWAQQNDGAKIVTVSQAVQNNNYTIQVGLPFLGQRKDVSERNNYPLDIRFPWDALYLYGTFAEEAFDVSKGYFGDKVEITWEIIKNYDLISSIKIYKREYLGPENPSPYNFIGSVAASATKYDDKYADGGVLYEYKVVAVGVSDIEALYTTYITGIGYRNPTAVVTGNVSYKGGNPVKDVIIKASSDGSGINEGSSLNVPATSSIKIEDLNKNITDVATFQVWIKPENQFTNDAGNPIRIFKLSSFDTTSVNVTVKLLKTSNKLSVNIGGSIYELHNYYPSGKISSRGDDIMIPVSNFNTSFVHFSVVMENNKVPLLYINGRAINNAYKDEVIAANEKLLEDDPNYLVLPFELTIPTKTTILSIGGNPTKWDDIYVGGLKGAFIDEIRVWKAALEPTIIRTDYSRYISGNDARLVVYLSANEKVGSFAYDFSREGFNYNKNHGVLWKATTVEANKITWAIGTGNFPTSDQLGILGVTDINGNFVISAIPYSGTGESFNITPLYGQHQFEPAQQLVFLGESSEVVNKIDFTDISSFSFKGKILYDTRGVFKSFVETNTELTHKIDYYLPSDVDATSEGYNYYQTYSDGKLSKGEYWYNEETERYEKYAAIYSEGVNIYVDGNIILDENNSPVVSKSADGLYGFFDIQVPIGNHYITVKKDGHEFKYGGRFPAETGTFKEFFEDSNEEVIFIDSTRVALVGKVVGGSVEAAKPIGFGDKGLYQKQVDINGVQETLTISSKNNIGIAAIKLGYIPPGTTDSELETEFNFETNIETGEYRVAVLPLKYQINQLSGLRIKNNASLSILESNEDVNLSKVEDLTIPQFEYPDGSFEYGEPYHYEKSFTYRTTPVLRVIEQTSDTFVEIDGNYISTQGFEFPVYTQFGNYEIKMRSFERYINKDSGSDVEDIVPIVDGEFKPTNNLALINSETIERDENDQSIQIYKFQGGMPSISSPFTRTIDLKYRINGIDYEAENYIKKGIVLGGQSDGSQTFTTAAPDIPDIILRDPPGSNSSASIQKGETITFTTNSSVNASGGLSGKAKISSGMKFVTGGGLAGPVIDNETIANVELNLAVTTGSTNGKSLTKTYSFNQTISTSDDPDYVGADGDLYIGQSKNYYYGSYDDVQSSSTPIGTSAYYELMNNDGESVFISKQKAMYFTEEPSATFFVFSQKYIISTLIPELELIIYNLDNGVISEEDEGVLERDYYVQQINLWRKIILENEHSKYRTINERAELKAGVDAEIASFISKLEIAIDNASLGASAGGYEVRLKNKLADSHNLQSLVNDKFEDNISFDAGVGEITRSVETTIIKNTSTTFNLKLDESISKTFGFLVNKIGVVTTASGFASQDLGATLSEEEVSTVNVSYTLKDNDPDNVLSVDVVNLFDGYGPIFSTIGGVTSCPYEGPELSIFYNDKDYDENATEIVELPEEKREQLSYATQRVEVPLISVEVADVSNVPERNNAEFLLLLENNSVSETDVTYELIVDNLSNPNNALINIAQNGTDVFVPYGQKVEYALTLGKSISDVYDYEDIRIVLQSKCDGSVFDDVLISAHFIPSCSEVEIVAPLTNWVFNNKTAYNIDNSVNSLPIKLGNFDTSFNNFHKLDLEYRLASSPNWTRLQTYYANQAFYDEAIEENQSNIAMIEGSELLYLFDVVDLQIPDGAYELRAISTCTNDTEYISDIVTGTVDLTNPRKFGTPLPIDGILGVGEDLKVSFNEPVFYNSAISTIEIKGQTNQLPINHSVSLYFEGESNTAVINKPQITKGDFTLEFWMNNSMVAANADIIKQNGGLNISLRNGELYFSIGGITAQGAIANDGLYHHYTFTHKNSSGEVSIFQDDAEIDGNTGAAEVDFTNNNPLIIGGNSFIGNIHELRIWNKTISLENAYAKMYDKLIGNEANLIGYWPMDEGRGGIAKDLARFKHAAIDADWDIKPKGTSYEFIGGQYLELDNVDHVQLTNEMDATISFWMKSGIAQEATLFSNGKGDGSDFIQSNDKANKWAVNITNSGMLTFESEGSSYLLTSESVADNNWHHITLLFNRRGSLRTYVDAVPVSSNLIANIGGFSGNKIWIGARGSIDLSGIETVDNTFTGNIDEFRLWNTLRNVEQINRDRFNEVDIESIGLMLYVRMNEPDPTNGNGPRYFHTAINETITASLSKLSTGIANYSNDAPTIKPERELIKFAVNHVINEDEMILEPVVSDWASLEGQIIDITVHRMFDDANNRQQSPITWSAYVKRNAVSWYAEGYNEIVDIVKSVGEENTFEIIIINKGGNEQPFTINNVPSWLRLSSSAGIIEPDSKVSIMVSIDKELTAGEYLENLYLQTDFGFDEKLQVKLRVLAEEPDWNINQSDFEYSMNIVGRIKIDGKFSEDTYDKIAAFYEGEVRGVINLVYLESFQEYYAYLTIYSNNEYGEEIEFSIWDASQGKIIEAVINGNQTTIFKVNEVLGNLTIPAIFENSDVLVQNIPLNEGWTWVSFNVNDVNFTNLNKLTSGLSLETDDRILSHSPAQVEAYYKDNSNPVNSTWWGSISVPSDTLLLKGLLTSKMYKVNFNFEQTLRIKGVPVNIDTWSFPIKQNWNWLPYPLIGNQAINEALAYFEAKDGDVIKSQNLFAIYDSINGWNGTLNYLEAGSGYMIKSSKVQTFTYPSYLAKPNSRKSSEIKDKIQPKIANEYTKYAHNMNAVVQLPEGFNSLLVYDTNGNIKGNTYNQVVEDKELCFITIYGDVPEILVFYVGDGRNTKATTKTINFKSDNVLGTIAKPIVLEILSSNVNVFPNPYEDSLTVKVDVLESETITIQLYSLTSQLLFSKEFKVTSGSNLLKISPKVATGIYLLHVKMKENTVISKVIKK